MSPRFLDHALEFDPSLAFGFRRVISSRLCPAERQKFSQPTAAGGTFSQLRPAAGDLVLLPDTG
jgi:hypothetical protein